MVLGYVLVKIVLILLNPFFSNDVTKNIRKIGVLILFVYLSITIIIAISDLTQIIQFSPPNLSNQIYESPSIDHLCGTDRLGRDVCLRTLKGSTIALEIVFLAMILSLGVGLPLGLISGFIGGLSDKILSLIMDTIFSIPVILLSVVTAFVLGKGILNAAFALCIVYSPQYFRLVRNQTLLVKSETFIEAASISGLKKQLIILKYILPNVLTPLPILLALNAADAVLVLGSLGFLGLGVPADVPEWGSDLNLALSALPTGIWWTALFPGLAMFFLVLSLSFIAEGLENSIYK